MRIKIVALGVVLLMALAACGGGLGQADVERLVQERVDAGKAELKVELTGLNAAKR